MSMPRATGTVGAMEDQVRGLQGPPSGPAGVDAVAGSASGSMRTMVIAATIGIGALRIVWRALSPNEAGPPDTSWTGDE